MPISVRNTASGDAVISLDERFDFGVVDQFRKSYESLSELKSKQLIIDFQNTRYMDSSALGMLINAKGFFDNNGVKIIITNTNEQIRKIFSISRFDTKFDIS